MYALIFYILTFSPVGDPANDVYKHNMESWKFPYTLKDKKECEYIATTMLTLRPHPENPGYKHLCVQIK
jgi:hypothetical protein